LENVLLDFYGVVFAVECPEKFASWVRHDFSPFVSAGAGAEPLFVFRVFKKSAFPQAQAFAESVYSNSDCIVFDNAAGRRIVFFDGDRALWDFAKREISFYSGNAEGAYLKFYDSLMTLAGRAFDLKGLHRIHCTCFSERGKAVLFLGEAGVGKTTLALNVLQNSMLGIVSDETILLGPKRGVFSFFTRFGIRGRGGAEGFLKTPARRLALHNGSEKFLVSAEALGSRLEKKARVSKIVVLRRNLSRNSFSGRASKPAVFWWLFRNSVLGQSIPQSPAYLFFPSISKRLEHATVYFSRFLAIASVVLFSDCLFFSQGSDKSEALERVLELFGG